MMEAGPVGPTFAALGSLRKVKQRQINDAIRKPDRIADRAINFVDPLEVKDTLVKGSRFFQIRNLDCDMTNFAHGDLSKLATTRNSKHGPNEKLA
jgi:hypothetical protein